MAGGKETPRQKMIGLMYLVLTAMLALNVDSAVLDRFIQINQALEAQNQKFQSENVKTVGAIQEKVKERGEKEEEVKIYQTAQEVRKKTADLIGYIENLKDTLVEKTGGYADSVAGTLEGAADMDNIATLMIRQKRGEELKTMLNDYASYLASLTNDTTTFRPIALDGKEDTYYSKIPNQRDKDFSQLYFESTPAAGGLASFSQLQSKVMDYETEVLDYLAGQVGASDVSFDNIVPLVVPESRYVAAGARFKAEMYAAASASNVSPSMTWGGSSIPVNENGVGSIDFKAVGGNYDKDGRVAKQVNTKIDINGQVYEQTYEYFVVKPVVQIQSASVQRLYLNCGNHLFVDVPALGQEYNPSFRGQGGDAIKGREKNKVTCIPTGRKFTLSVINDGALIDNVVFNVQRIPKPDIILKGDGSDVDEMKGVSSPPRELALIAVPDDDFKSALPDDARYRVSEWDVIWARGSRAVDRQTVQGPEFRVPAGWRQMRPNDRIVIEVKGVQRRNFRNQVENIVIGAGQRVKQIPIN